MTLIGILYILAVAVALGACIPQIVQLLKVRRSDEFELSTWGVWLGAQAISLLYVISLGDVLMIAANGAWVAFYAVMVYLIVHFRFIKKPLQEVPVGIKP